MRKTLGDVADYLKEIMVPAPRQAYPIHPAYEGVWTQAELWEGVLAFRAFLERLYEALTAEGSTYDRCQKAAHAYENRITLSVYYPFLHQVKTMLLHIGYQGVVAQSTGALVCGKDLFPTKLPVSKHLACLRFLAGCGLEIQGIDLDDPKQSLSDLEAIQIDYPNQPKMLTGLKIMATAEIDHGTLDNQDILLRCDHRVLRKQETDGVGILQDTIRPLPQGVQDFILHLHHHAQEMGLACLVEIKGFWIYVKYCCQRRDVWGINASLRNGYHLNIKAEKTQEYPDTIQAFPAILQDLISKGYGCGRKRAGGHCDGGCRGLILPLDETILLHRENLLTWLHQEVACRRKK